MAKRVFRFPIGTLLLALLCASIPVFADNMDLASAEPAFDRSVALVYSGFNDNSQLFSLSLPGNVAADGRFIPELRITTTEISWLNCYQGGGYPDFGKDKGGDFSWKKHYPRSVPEPSSLTFLGTSVLVVAFSLRRRLHR